MLLSTLSLTTVQAPSRYLLQNRAYPAPIATFKLEVEWLVSAWTNPGSLA